MVAAALLAALLPLPALASGGSSPAFVSPAAGGVVEPGDSVRVALASSQPSACARTTIRAYVGAGKRTVAGPVLRGCAGVVRLPSAEAVDRLPRGVARYAAVRARTAVGESLLPLRLKRTEGEHARVVSGTATPARGGMQVQTTGTTLSLGPVVLTRISSLSLTSWSPQGFAGVCLYDGFCSAGRAVATVGAPDGPVVAEFDLPVTDGPARPVRRTSALRGGSGSGELFVTFSGHGPVTVDSFELNGRGVAERHTFPRDERGTVTLFDGTSLAGWKQAGSGGMTLVDGAMRTDGVAPIGLFWYHRRDFADFRLRLEFRTEKFEDNSGIFVRFPDPGDDPWKPVDTGYEMQIDDYGLATPTTSPLAQTGGVYSFRGPSRIATNAVGEWNTYEITAVGQRYTLRINGRVVTTYTGNRSLRGFVGLQTHDPASKVYFRDVRVLPLG